LAACVLPVRVDRGRLGPGLLDLVPGQPENSPQGQRGREIPAPGKRPPGRRTRGRALEALLVLPNHVADLAPVLLLQLRLVLLHHLVPYLPRKEVSADGSDPPLADGRIAPLHGRNRILLHRPLVRPPRAPDRQPGPHAPPDGRP